MSTVASDGSLFARRRASPVQTYAKVAGVLVVLMFVAGWRHTTNTYLASQYCCVAGHRRKKRP